VPLRGRLGFAKIAVLTITAEEFEAAQRIFAVNVHIPATTYYVTGLSATHEYEVVLRQASDRTNTPAAEAVADLVEYLSPEFLLVVGTAGGVRGREAVALGDVLIADYVQYGEFRKRLPGSNRARNVPLDHPSLFLRDRFASPLRRSGDWLALIDMPRPALLPILPGRMDRIMAGLAPFAIQKALAAAQANQPLIPKALEGTILSGEKIWGDPDSDDLQDLLREYDKAVAMDTESYGVARAVCSQRTSRRYYNPQYLVVRGISDFVNSSGNEAQRREWTAYAASAASAFARRLSNDLLGSAIWE